MEQYIDKAVELIASADIYLLAIVGVLMALLPVIRKTKNKTDDKIADQILSVVNKVRGLIAKYTLKNKTK